MVLPVTKTVVINRSPAEVFAFLADGKNWPRFAIHNVFSAQPGRNEGEWIIDTPRGPGELHLKPVASYGIVDHVFVDAQEGRWNVPARVVPAGEGSVFMMTLTKPEPMTEQDFQKGMTLLDEELATLKRLLEASSLE